MNPKAKKIVLWTLGALAVLLLVGLGVFLLKREQLLRYALGQAKQKIERRYPVTLTLGPARFTDLNSVQIDGIALVPKGSADTLLTARSVNASISLRSLFARRPVFSNLQIVRARLTAHKTEAGADNYGFLLKKRGQAAVARDTTQGTNYGLLANQLLEAGFDNLPDEADFRDFLVTYDSPRHQARLTMPQLTIDDGDLAGELAVVLDSVSNRIGLRGHVEPGDYEAQVEVYGQNRRPVLVPYVQRRYGARVQFDTLRLSLTGKEMDDENLTVRGAASAANFAVNHPKLATADIKVRRGGLDFVATLGRNHASLDKGSVIRLNRMELYPQLSVRLRPEIKRINPDPRMPTAKPYTGKLAGLEVAVKVESAETKTNDFFASLPEGVFDVLQGVQGTGTLQYRMSAALDMTRIDSLQFDSGLKKSADFSITRFGQVDLRKLNTEFPYTAYNDKGDSVKTFLVGPSNPDFVPFDQVSNYLKYAIVTAEDPRFFTHKGFMEKAFVKSAIQNIKEKRFARGGSTLSMQLVKNVFLTREKVVARKIEEALIVWIIENNRLVSKQRMMEVYLNIIEWGPSRYRWPNGERGVYGVGEAAQFYYGKEPRNLNLQESLYLASIIPKPKYARYSFDAYGDLRRSTRYFFRLIADIMAARGYIPQDEADNLSRSVSLTGPARQFMSFAARPDTTRTTAVADSSQFEPINLIDLLNTGGASPDEGVNTTAPRQDEEPAQGDKKGKDGGK
ncbi:biosynthetic peptidoglycan transglycosylase [Hymenobacter busanensis]|uniref:biosynthetic peptidoglycan transglycosylase n=1 Tax=Hymenobacter busanensis TaxID=2607656 RepID=UPI0013675A50|nr:biosynthetic peptidoglycan transglycosylase [Hymenobacter busanensis]QHJ09459.1 penicillin-binding protein [Hymenobacter busanensis]